MAKVLATVTFEYECYIDDTSDLTDEKDVLEKVVKKAKRDLNADSLTIHDIQVEIVE